MKQASKVFIIISMVLLFWLIIPIIVGIFALQKLNQATKKDELTTIAIVTLIFCSFLGGLFMLFITDQDLVSNAASKTSDKTDIEKLKELKGLLDSGTITQEEFDTMKTQYMPKI